MSEIESGSGLGMRFCSMHLHPGYIVSDIFITPRPCCFITGRSVRTNVK